MNNLETEMHKIIELVVSSCVTTITKSGELSLTKEDVLGNSRKENVSMTRTILAYFLHKEGFSTTTISQLLCRSERHIRKMFEAHDMYSNSSRAYVIACEEIKRKLEGTN